jgi:16S rRNA (cytidine1402-2'-O)-methyltransferase
MAVGKVILIPTVLHEDADNSIPSYVIEQAKLCDAYFVENEKTARRYLKKYWREMVIDNYQWRTIHKAEVAVVTEFISLLKQGKNIGIISEAGCPGVADPGQILVAAAQEKGFEVCPLVGPNSILLALMASGMNGQSFSFHGYLPIDSLEKKKAIAQLEQDSHKKNTAQIFIETPYRNNQLIKDLLQYCHPQTKICIAVDITAPTQWIKTKTVAQWKKETVDIHKRLAIFLLQA